MSDEYENNEDVEHWILYCRVDAPENYPNSYLVIQRKICPGFVAKHCSTCYIPVTDKIWLRKQEIIHMIAIFSFYF